jgi:hypothetical protein
MRYRVLITVSSLVTLILLAGFISMPSVSNAQSTRMDRQHHQSDMWNPNWMQREMWGTGPDGAGHAATHGAALDVYARGYSHSLSGYP